MTVRYIIIDDINCIDMSLVANYDDFKVISQEDMTRFMKRDIVLGLDHIPKLDSLLEIIPAEEEFSNRHKRQHSKKYSGEALRKIRKTHR